MKNFCVFWLNFECFVYGGVLIVLYVDELCVVFGVEVNFYEVYFVLEGFIVM